MEQDARIAALVAKSGSVLCAFDDIDDGCARVFALGNWRDGLEIIVVRVADRIYGYLNICAHLSLPLNIDSRVRTANGMLLCDHHFAAFRVTDGLCTAGVCLGLSLARVALAKRDGAVVIV